MKTNYIGTPQSRVATEPVYPGSIILTDEHRMYWDSPDGKRYEVTDIIELESEVARQSISKPLNKFYYVLSTNTLYRYNNGWKNLSAGGSGGGGGGEQPPVEPFELTIEKLVPFASNDVPSSIGDTGSPGTGQFYSRSDHTHAIDFSNMSFDCGYFPGVTPPTPIAIHNITTSTHQYLVIDGNVMTPSRSDYASVEEHIADPLAHSDMIVDGNDTIGELKNVSLAEHSVNKRSHANMVIDGNITITQ